MSTLRIAVSVFLVLVCSAAFAQTSTPASALSLAAAMRYIQDTMNAQGKISYTLHVHDNSSGQDWPAYQIAIDATNFVADPATCRITWHVTTTRDGQVGVNKDYLLDMHRAYSIEVRTSAVEAKKEDAARNQPNLDKTQDPPYFAVAVLVDYPEAPLYFSSAEIEPTFGAQTDPRYRWIPLFITSEETANHVRDVLMRTSELCLNGGH